MSRFRKIVVGAAAAILFYQLIVPPVVGLADNADFARVIGRFNLHGKVHGFGQFIDTTYEFHPRFHWVSDFYSTEIALVWPAIAINTLLSKDGNFDLRFIGIVHAALFLAALWLFIPLLAGTRRAMRIGICVLILFVYCDAKYVSALNSFYMDESAYLFLLLSVVLYLRVVRWRMRQDTILMLVCVLLLAASKTQHAPLAIVFAALLFMMRKTLWPDRRRIIAAAAGCIVIAASLMIWNGARQQSAPYAVYNVIFVQLIPHARNPERTLADLGLNDSYGTLIGRSAYLPDSGMSDPAFRAEFSKRVSMPRLAVFYLMHPRDGYRAIRTALGEAGRQSLFGNFDRSAGYPPFAQSRAFSIWSGLNRRLFAWQGTRVLSVLVALSAIFSALLLLRRKSLLPGILPGGFALVAMAMTALLCAALPDTTDWPQRHFIFFTLLDMMGLAIVYLGVTSLARLATRRRNSRETEQPERIVMTDLVANPLK